MDKATKKELNTLIGNIEEAGARIREIASEEQDSFDERSEKWQEGDAGQTAMELIDTLNTAADGLEEAGGNLSGIAND